MVPGVNGLSRSGGRSWNLFSVWSGIDLLSPERINRPFTPNIPPSVNIFPQKETFCSKINLHSLPSHSVIIGNSPMERIGLEKTMLNRSGINVISYDLSHSARVHPACTLPCSKIVDHIYCPESERIRGAKINIWCPTLLSPVPGTTHTWPTPKKYQYISEMEQDIFWYSESLNVVLAETFGHRLPKFSKVFWKMISFQPSNGREKNVY